MSTNVEKRIVLTVKEVAEMLGVSNTTIYTMVRLGEIPHAKARNKILFHRETVEHWLINQHQQALQA
ncbi:helix-turn-helix domain-containing protein [Chungangia koreensis]|uniref:Helix-turn-helix domain-containing protein n=1 Tax=Chungangia koreensis TaxID=752657 RepID=A0ABV8X0H4_9LACT